MDEAKQSISGQRTRTRRKLGLVVFLTIAIGVLFGFWQHSNRSASDPRQDIIGRIKRQLLTTRTSTSEPINILLIGSDSRDGEDARSDTLIFLNVNFQARRAYLVSIPRDTRVYIPGYGQDKINAAYAYGQAELSIRTIEDFLGVDLNHFVEVDFEGFKDMVDTLGGIDINVKKGIDDRSYQYRMRIPTGRQRMDGETALNYVRYRHGDSDFNRAGRQQEFLKALAANAFRPRTVLKLPKLVGILNENVGTDMSDRDMLGLANFLRNLPKTRMDSITLAGESTMIGGISFVEPDPVFLVELMERVEAGRSLKSMKSWDESDKMSMDFKPGQVVVLNGSGKAGLATRARARLVGYGVSGVRIGNAESYAFKRTRILFAHKDKARAQRLRRLLYQDAVLKETAGTSTSDIRIILGFDYYRAGRI